MSVVQDRDSSGWSDLEARKAKVDIRCLSCRTATVQAGVTWRQGKVKWTWGVSRAGQDSSGWSDLEARKGKVDMGCLSCRTATVQAGVTWRQER